MFEIINFRGADKIIKEKKMTNIVRSLMQYLDDCLYGTRHKGELMRQALKENDWRQNGDVKIFEGRRYAYKGLRNRVAIDGNFASYETALQGALFRLQLGYDHKKIDVGIVMIPSQRSEKSKLGSTKDLVTKEMELLSPTISIPAMIVLFDLGKPGEIYEENRQKPEKVIKKKDDDHDLVSKYLHGNKQYESEPEPDEEVIAESRRRKPAIYKKTMINDQKIAA